MNIDLLISSISKHISLRPAEIIFFKALLLSKTLQAGEFLLKEGEVCRMATFVTKGCLKTYYLDNDGIEHIIDFSIEEWWADDLYSLLTQTHSTSAIKALEPTEIIQISKSDLELLYKQIPQFERFFRILFQNAYIAQREQINLTLWATAEDRYSMFLQKKPYAEKRFSQKDIASYLGITPQFLSVVRKKLRQVNVD